MSILPEQPELGSFEKKLERLSDIVSKLESSETPLEEMLRLYEEGTTLSADLTKLLRHAELKVETLTKIHEELSGFETEPFKES
jgi:exodeoxyribonuclease VII small subunit